MLQALNETAVRLTSADHYATDQINSQIKSIKTSQADLLSKAKQRLSRLEESLSLQQFLRDAEEAKNWISEKSKIAGDESYKDPSNLEVKVQQHQDFEAELQANKGRIDAVVEMGKDLREAAHFAADNIK